MRKAILPLLFLAACDLPTPNAPADPIGEAPKWGLDFATQGGTSSTTAMMSGAQTGPTGAPGPAPAAGTGAPQQGGSLTPNQPNPFAGESWGGGDPKVGQQVWVTMCQRCHGAAGEGGSIPGQGVVPTLADKAWQTRTTDKDIASIIAHGKGAMPSFMSEMNKDQIDGVIAFVRTLAK
jgi:mono/diheme cytochrome c family protein